MSGYPPPGLMASMTCSAGPLTVISIPPTKCSRTLPSLRLITCVTVSTLTHAGRSVPIRSTWRNCAIPASDTADFRPQAAILAGLRGGCGLSLYLGGVERRSGGAARSVDRTALSYVDRAQTDIHSGY